MDSTDLRCFVTIARHSSFTRAAEQLYLTQPALSKRLRRLENELGTRLFDRSTTAVVLTATGARLLTHATDLLDRWEGLVRQATGHADEPAAVPVRLGVYDEYSDRLSTHLAAAAPELAVDLVVVQPPEAVRRLDAGELDAAMVYELPGLPTHPAVAGAHMATLVTESQWVVLGRTHPLADRPAVGVRDVVAAGTPWLVSPPGHPTREWEQTYLTGRCADAVLRTADDAGLPRIAIGKGAALASPQNVPTPDLVLLPLEPVVLWHHYLVWLPHRVPPAAGEALLAALRGFERRQAQRHPRYWEWLRAHPEHATGLLP